MTGPVTAFRISVPRESEDAAIAALSDQSTLGIEHVEAEGPDSILLAYFPEAADLEPRLRGALAGLAGAHILSSAIPELDWVERFRASFVAFDAGGFRIVPEWDEQAERDVRTLVVDPGRAFGTGTHATTRLCLAALERLARGPGLGSVADIGAGSGILGIAALRLGARLAVGIDDDPEATASAARHARLNGVDLLVAQGDCALALRPRRFDTVLANLMAPLLVERRHELAALCRAGGRLVLSGLLDNDLPAIRDAFAGCGTISESHDGEWAAVVVEL